MPNPLFDADIGFPNLDSKKTTDDKLKAVESYLFILLEALRYSFQNIDKSNFNNNALTEITEEIQEPLTIEIKNTEETVSHVTQNVTNLEERATGIEETVGNVAQDVTALEIRATGIETTVESKVDAEQASNIASDVTNTFVSNIIQAADFIQSSVVNEKIKKLDEDMRGYVLGQVSSSITQTAERWQAEFSNLETMVNENGVYINNQKTYITEDINGITIAKDGNAVKAVFGVESLKFVAGTLTLAEFSKEELTVDSVRVKKQMSFDGEWAFRKGATIPNKGNNLNLYYLGG